jgi:hypothetical protein
MGTITKNYIIIILFEKNYNEERMSVLSSLETSSSPASPSSCRKNHIVCKLNILFNHFQSKCLLGTGPWSGADPGFQVRGAHLKKLRRAEGGSNIFGVFRVKNHDFTPKNHFFPILGGAGCAPPWILPCWWPLYMNGISLMHVHWSWEDAGSAFCRWISPL